MVTTETFSTIRRYLWHEKCIKLNIKTVVEGRHATQCPGGVWTTA